jgi:hypothetical protein
LLQAIARCPANHTSPFGGHARRLIPLFTEVRELCLVLLLSERFSLNNLGVNGRVGFFSESPVIAAVQPLAHGR